MGGVSGAHMIILDLLCAPSTFPENALLSQPDLARSVRSLPERRLLDGYRLVGKIESTREKLLIGQHTRCKIGVMPPVTQQEKVARYFALRLLVIGVFFVVWVCSFCCPDLLL